MLQTPTRLVPRAPPLAGRGQGPGLASLPGFPGAGNGHEVFATDPPHLVSPKPTQAGTNPTGLHAPIFGPVMLLWFVAIGVLGLRGIARSPMVLGALSPHHAVFYLVHVGPGIGFAMLGAAFLVVTGGEAMYADPELIDRPGRRCAPSIFRWILKFRQLPSDSGRRELGKTRALRAGWTPAQP
jgi:hypothetical protein